VAAGSHCGKTVYETKACLAILAHQMSLMLLLMKAVNRKNPVTGRYAISPYRGLSFLGYRYVSPGLLDRLRGKEIDIYYDRRDISVIYLFEEGERRRRSVLYRTAWTAHEHLGGASTTKE
jgi:hypothetical protein